VTAQRRGALERVGMLIDDWRSAIARLWGAKSRARVAGQRESLVRHDPGVLLRLLYLRKRRDKPAWGRRWKSSTPKG